MNRWQNPEDNQTVNSEEMEKKKPSRKCTYLLEADFMMKLRLAISSASKCVCVCVCECVHLCVCV